MPLKIALFVGVLLLTSVQESHAFSFTAVGGYAMPTATFYPASSSSITPHSLGLTFGGLMGFRMIPAAHVELGVLYGPRGYSQDGSEVTFTTVQLPLLLRIYPAPSISIGLGGYFSHGFGNYSSGADLYAYSFSTFGADDSGAVISFSLKIGIIASTSLVLDARYLYGFNNISKTSGVTTTLSDFQFLAGIRFGK